MGIFSGFCFFPICSKYNRNIINFIGDIFPKKQKKHTRKYYKEVAIGYLGFKTKEKYITS